MTHEAGKGDKMRPTNHEAFSKHFDEIFKQNRDRVVCPDCGKEFWIRADTPHIHTCSPQHVTK
jgi:ribosomal protein L37AE/L43A